MYHGSLPEASNRATYSETLGAKDAESGADIDMSVFDIVLEIACPCSGTVLLTATTDNGKITTPADGVIVCTFSRSEMVGICPGTYNVGITVSDDDSTEQYFIGTVAVLDGVVSP